MLMNDDECGGDRFINNRNKNFIIKKILGEFFAIKYEL